MPRAYSYLRFSTPRQQFGDSKRRQLERSQEWCARNGVELDAAFQLSDLGVSAYRGANAKTGALGAFLEAAEQGLIPKNSLLIVESLDRISRQQIADALQLFLRILATGVSIVTLEPERVHTSASINDIAGILEPLVVMSRANEESATKSSRMTNVWSQKRISARAGKPIGKHRPWWVDYVDGSYRPIPDRVEVVRKIFTMRADGHGIPTIVKELNKGTVKPRHASNWSSPTVAKIIRSRSVLGEFQPCRIVDGEAVPTGDAIPNYYPEIVALDDFHRAQLPGTRRGRNQNEDTTLNIFQGLIFGSDNHTCHVLNSRTKRNGKTFIYEYITSSGRISGVKNANRTRIRYDVFERAFLAFVEELDPSDFLATGATDLSVQISEASGRLAELDHNLSATVARATASKDAAVYYDLIEKLGEEKASYSALIEKLESQQSSHGVDVLGEVKTLGTLLREAKEEEARELRVRIRNRIRQIVAQVILHPTFNGYGYRKKTLFDLVVCVSFKKGFVRWFKIDQDGLAEYNKRFDEVPQWLKEAINSTPPSQPWDSEDEYEDEAAGDARPDVVS